MRQIDTARSLAEVSARLVQDYDLPGVLVRVIAEAVEATQARAGGLIVLNGQGELELLSATTHRAADLEAYQAASAEGPCRACMDVQGSISVTLDDARERWSGYADAMATSGFGHALATPLRWRGTALGGLNLFWDQPRTMSPDTVMVAQAFSDAMTLAIMNARGVGPDLAQEHIQEALAARIVIERAKGVLAQQLGLSMEQAFARLLSIADERDMALTSVAEQVIERAYRHDDLGPDGPGS